MTPTPRRLVVIGAGPIGLAAALGALERGFEVTVFEKGVVGDALRRWGSVRLFTPLRMNLPARARDRLGPALPPDDALLTGPQMALEILHPLAAAPPLAGRVKTGHEVIAVGRAGLARGDLSGHPLRAERPFRVLVRTPEGERAFEAEAVLDASGVYDVPAFAGTGGLPARGERAVASRLTRHLGALETRLGAIRGRRALLIGHGHSAANALEMLRGLASSDPETRVMWATRSAQRRPCEEIAADPLPERRRVASAANDLAERPPPWLTVERRTTVESIGPDGAHGERLRVVFSTGRQESFDEVAALTGYRPDLGFLSELPLEISPVTEGAARLSRALAGIRDCLAVPCVSPSDLDSGEPGFHLIGSKGYGRSRTFLIGTGLAQLETILERLGS